MSTKILIARHGNTFTKDQTPTRVGARTDLPLVEEERGTMLGEYLKDTGLIPNVVYASPLARCMQTAKLALTALGSSLEIIPDHSFVEIDYGEDENKTEDEVMLRLGKTYLTKDGKDAATTMSEEEIKARGEAVINLWNEKAIVPDGWVVDPNAIIKNWQDFAQKVDDHHKGENVLIVSSNGVIRFAPYLTGDFEKFSSEHDIKVGTGNLCIFEKNDGEENWRCTGWNIKPKDYFKNKG